MLWYIKPEEFDKLQEGTLSSKELKQRVAKRDDGQHPLTDFGGGD